MPRERNVSRLAVLATVSMVLGSLLTVRLWFLQAVDARGLHREVQLLRPNSRWTHAVSISGGDFAGSNTWDLMVRTDDGTLLLLPDVDERGLHQEIRVRPPGSLWTHATVATAGAYAGDVWTDDYLVRWSDGEVSMYVDSGTALPRAYANDPSAQTDRVGTNCEYRAVPPVAAE